MESFSSSPGPERTDGEPNTLPEGWRLESCSRCSGFGVVWIGLDGGPGECAHCVGGLVCVTPKGRHVLYPGGPFV